MSNAPFQALLMVNSGELPPSEPLVKLVSDLYPLALAVDEINVESNLVGGFFGSLLVPESLDASSDIVAGELVITTTYQTYSNWPSEALDAESDIVAGELVITTTYQTYSSWPSEALNAESDIVAGELVTV